MENTGKKIVRNTLFIFVSRIWGYIIAIVLTPYMVSKLGNNRFGVWTVISSIICYAGLIDLGIGSSFIRYIAEYDARKDYKSISKVVNAGVIFYSIIGIITVSGVYYFRNSIMHILSISNGLLSETIFVLVGIVMISALSNTFGVFSAVISGLQRMDITNSINIVMSTVQAVGIVVVLHLGYGLKGLTLMFGIYGVTGILVNIFYTYKLIPQLRFNPLSFRFPDLKGLLNYGAKMQVVRLAGIMNIQLDKVLLAHFIPDISNVTFYEIGSQVARVGGRFPMILLYAIMPAAAELNARIENDRLYKLYLLGSKYLAVFVIPFAVFTAIFAKMILYVWMGAGYERSVILVQLLTIGYSLNLLTGIGTSIAQGVGKVMYEMNYSILMVVLNVVLSTVFIVQLGLKGAAIGACIAMSLSSLYFMIQFHKQVIPGKLFEISHQIYSIPLVSSIIAGLMAASINGAVGQTSGKWKSFGLLTVDGSIFLIIYALMIVKLSYFKHDEIRNITKNIRIPDNIKVHLKIERIRGIMRFLNVRRVFKTLP